MNLDSFIFLLNMHSIRIRGAASGAARARAVATVAAKAGAGRNVRLASTHSAAVDGDKDGREKVVILGSGWGGYKLSRALSSKYAPLVISPRSYFVFTPLLTDAASGSLDFSNIVEPVRDPHAQVDFIQAAAREIDFRRKTVRCEATVVKSGVTESPRTNDDERIEEEGPESTTTNAATVQSRRWEQGETFDVPYDKLVIAVGAVSKTFQTPGVRHNAMFFRDIGDARRVKRRVRECFELAVLPTTSPEMRRHLLHFAIVGAGPTGTELAANLRDYIYQDVVRLYPAVQGIPRITLYDVAPKVLSMFDESLSRYAMDTMRKEGIAIKTEHHVKSLRWGAPGQPPPHDMDPKRCLTLTTEEEGEVGVGMCVWATGNAMNKFLSRILNLDSFPANSALLKDGSQPSPDPKNAQWQIKKAPGVGALLVDGHLRVQLESNTGQTAVMQDVFALGDNAMLETGSPPATAQATTQEAKWLASRLNQDNLDTQPPFSFRDMGSLAYIGNANALMQIPSEDRSRYLPSGLTGRSAALVWNWAYVSMSISWRNKLRMVFRRMVNWLYGRDVSRY